MAIPEFQSFMLPLLRLASSESLRTADAITKIADEFTLSEEDREERLASGRQTQGYRTLEFKQIDTVFFEELSE